MSKRALKLARKMAAADPGFIGKGSGAGVRQYLPTAIFIDEVYKLCKKSEENQKRIMQQGALVGILPNSPVSDDEINERVKNHLGSPNFTGLPQALAAILPGNINARILADQTVPVLLDDIDNVLSGQPG